MNSKRSGPTILVVVAITYLLLSALAQVFFAWTGIRLLGLPWMFWIYLGVFDTQSLVLLLVYWMTMRRIGTDWRTWAVPLSLVIAALSLQHLSWMLMPILVGSISLWNLLSYFLWIAMSEALTIWFSASMFLLLSQVFGVYLMPSHLESRQTDAVEWRSFVRAVIGVNVALLVVVFCFSPTLYFGFLMPNVLSTLSTACLWFGLSAVVANGLRSFSTAGLICLISAVTLTLVSHLTSFFQNQRLVFGGMNPQIALISFLLLALKWLLFYWVLKRCGYRLVTRNNMESINSFPESDEANTMVEKIENEPPVQQWII